jgi:hypothetical protein
MMGAVFAAAAAVLGAVLLRAGQHATERVAVSTT